MKFIIFELSSYDIIIDHYNPFTMNHILVPFTNINRSCRPPKDSYSFLNTILQGPLINSISICNHLFNITVKFFIINFKNKLDPQIYTLPHNFIQLTLILCPFSNKLHSIRHLSKELNYITTSYLI